MPPAGFEPTISAGERPQTYALDRAATGIGSCILIASLIYAPFSPLDIALYPFCRLICPSSVEKRNRRVEK